MFEIIYRCKECGEVLRTHEKADLSKDTEVYMPWPCRDCADQGRYIPTDTGIPLTRIAADLGQDDYYEEEED